ncbi:hypothetical protein LN42_00495 [Marinitoga sp. 1137]|uniref:hypothetical protein n=1 Tax=Marinitoga sp. 1137 TaxID=1545835 RepID=UPI0009506CFC|nr:hypothetical protein [Marinitoga sp. 1137]APT75044.1 hypothetical protein LN42_00495 [Marinitoga sp. 1137]
MATIEKKNLWEIDSIEEFSKNTGYSIDFKALEEAKKKMKKQTEYGEVELNVYEGLVIQKLFEYFRFGIFDNITKIMKQQDAHTSLNEVKMILLEMARYEIEYGLKPLLHTIPIAKKIYITAEGFLYYAQTKGNIKTIDYETSEIKPGLFKTICTVITNDGKTQKGYATVKATGNKMDDPEERSRTKALRRALRRLYPIGAMYEEAYIENEETSIPSIPEIHNIPTVKEETNKDTDTNNDDVVTALPEEQSENEKNSEPATTLFDLQNNLEKTDLVKKVFD